MAEIKCILCKDELDPDSPFVLYGLNPNTFRKAWMHNDCFNFAYEDLASMPAKNPLLYRNRQEEYQWTADKHF